MSTWEFADGKLLPSADWYAAFGWRVFPTYGLVGGKCECRDESKHRDGPKDWGKHPRINEWQNHSTTDRTRVAEWWHGAPDSNVAVHCEGSGMIVIDVDPRNGGDESWDVLESRVGGLPATVEACTGEYMTRSGARRGRHLFFKVKDGEAFKGNLNREGLKGIDIKHKGYVLVAPSRHGSGYCYEWAPGKAPWQMAVADAPEELLAEIRKRPYRAPGTPTEFGVVEWNGEKVDLDALLAEGIHEGEREVKCYMVACILSNQYPVATAHGKASVHALMRGINAKHVFPPLDYDERLAHQVDRAIQFVIENPKGAGLAAALGPGVMEWVRAQTTAGATVADKPPAAAGSGAPTSVNGPPAVAAAGGAAGAGAGGGGMASGAMPVNPGDALPPDADEWGNDAAEAAGGGVIRRTLTDRGNARRLRDHYAGTVKYTEGMGWFLWNGEYWQPDSEGLGVLEKSQVVSRLITRELLGLEAGEEEWKRVAAWALQSKNTSKLRSAIDQWKADSEMTRAPVEMWDNNPHLLGVKNGVVDLKTGNLLQGTIDMGITKRAEAAYTPGMRNIRWETFLDFATGGDKELQLWLQKAAGYTLTGLRDYDVLFMVFGQPGSGKSTFLEALGHVLGKGYMTSMNSNVLVDDGMKSSSDDYHWAQLRGKRMVVFSEWPQGRRTKEDAVKRLTGDMTIQARHPHERPFNFESQAKLWIGTNELPQVNEEAMWRRIRAIPFPYVPSAPDPGLKPYLMDPAGGLPAVMSWAIEGAVRVISSPERDALGWCSAVAAASAEYRQNEDRMGIFLEEETVLGEGSSVPVKMLWDVYRIWAEDRGEKPMTVTPFKKALEKRGLKVDGMGRRAVLHGRSLMPRVAEAPAGVADWSDLIRSAR